MNTQITKIGFCDHGTYCIRHTTDTKLETSTIWNFFNDKFRNGLINRCCLACTHLCNRRIVTFYNMCYLRNMYTFIETAQTSRHVLVNLYNDNLCSLAHAGHMRSTWSEVKETMFIHWCHLEHRHMDRFDILCIITRQFRITNRCIKGKSLIHCLTFDSGHMPGIPAKMICRVLNIKNSRTP